MKSLKDLCSLIYFIQSEIHDIHFLASGSGFFTLHEVAGDYYNKLLEFYDDLAEEALASGELLNPTADANQFVDLKSNMKPRSVESGFSQIFLLLSKLSEELKDYYNNSALISQNISLRTKFEEIISWIKKEAYYKLDSLLKSESNFSIEVNFSATMKCEFYVKEKDGSKVKKVKYAKDDESRPDFIKRMKDKYPWAEGMVFKFKSDKTWKLY